MSQTAVFEAVPPAAVHANKWHHVVSDMLSIALEVRIPNERLVILRPEFQQACMLHRPPSAPDMTLVYHPATVSGDLAAPDGVSISFIPWVDLAHAGDVRVMLRLRPSACWSMPRGRYAFEEDKGSYAFMRSRDARFADAYAKTSLPLPVGGMFVRIGGFGKVFRFLHTSIGMEGGTVVAHVASVPGVVAPQALRDAPA